MKITIVSSAVNHAVEMDLPITSQLVHAGFPSPADDHIESTLDLNKALIKHPSATFFVKVDGESMKDIGINTGDILVVDRAIDPYNGAVAVCFLDGEFTLKKLEIDNDTIYLIPANENYKIITVSKEDDFTVWGIVTYSIKKHF